MPNEDFDNKKLFPVLEEAYVVLREIEEHEENI
jgi:hypothetical protein